MLSIIVFLIFMPPDFFYGLSNFQIFRKDISTIMSGTGRFDTFGECIHNSFSTFYDLFGVGFGSASRLAGDSLHTCHNSILSSLDYLGLVGFFISILILIFSVLFVAKHALTDRLYFSKSRDLRIYQYFLVLSSPLMGIATSYYPGTPSMLLFFGLSSYIMATDHRVSSQELP